MSTPAPLSASPPSDGPVPGDVTSSRVPAWRLLVRNPVTVASAVVLALVVTVGLTASSLAPYGINEIDVANALQPPSSTHWFGTDDLGRDLMSRVMVATTTSLQVAIVSVLIAFVAGVAAGVTSGFLRGWTDTIVMRVVDVMFAFPVILLALAIIAVAGPGLTTTMVAIGIVYTPIFARVARAAALSVSVEPYVQVSRTMGVGSWFILRRHVLPNIAAPVIVQTSLSLAFAILTEASLSFLGLGVQPPQPSWGGLLFDAQSFLASHWWLSVFPGVAILVTVLAFNLLGDGLRDIFDPKQRSIMEARMPR